MSVMIIYANIFFKIKTDESLNPAYSKNTATEFIYENSIIKNIENRINTLILFKRLFFLFSMYVKILPYLNQLSLHGPVLDCNHFYFRIL